MFWYSKITRIQPTSNHFSVKRNTMQKSWAHWWRPSHTVCIYKWDDNVLQTVANLSERDCSRGPQLSADHLLPTRQPVPSACDHFYSSVLSHKTMAAPFLQSIHVFSHFPNSDNLYRQIVLNSSALFQYKYEHFSIFISSKASITTSVLRVTAEKCKHQHYPLQCNLQGIQWMI